MMVPPNDCAANQDRTSQADAVGLALSPTYDQAWGDMLTYIRDRFSPQAIVVSGTIVRGEALASSDFDVVVIHEPAWRQRVQRFCGGVPADIFANPAFQIRRSFERQATEARPVLAHTLATGVIVDDSTGIATALRTEAIANLAAGPTAEPAWVELRRYGIATLFEDAADVVQVAPQRSQTLAFQALTEAVDWWFPAHGRRPCLRSLPTTSPT